MNLTITLVFIIQAEFKKFCHEPCSLDIFLHHLKDIDFYSLLGLCVELDASEIEAVDVHNGSLCILKGEYALELMRAINTKLRVVELKKLSFGKDFLRYVWCLMVIVFLNHLSHLAVISTISLLFMFFWSCNDRSTYAFLHMPNHYLELWCCPFFFLFDTIGAISSNLCN